LQNVGAVLTAVKTTRMITTFISRPTDLTFYTAWREVRRLDILLLQGYIRYQMEMKLRNILNVTSIYNQTISMIFKSRFLN